MASRRVPWLPRKDALPGEFLYRRSKRCLESMYGGWRVSSKPAFPCSAMDPGVGAQQTTFSQQTLSAGFLLGFTTQDTGEGPEGRRGDLFLRVCWLLCLCHSGGTALHPGSSYGLQPPAFGGTPSTDRTAPLLRTSISSPELPSELLV